VDPSLTAALGLGFLLGVRHALEADHVAAISTLVTRDRGVVRSCLRGTLWGVGHTAALLAAGVAVMAFKLRISPDVERVVERAIALVLVLLGGHVLLRVLGRATLHRHEHVHDGVRHQHLHVHVGEDGHEHVHLLAGSRRPLLLGLLHGLGGSGALVLVVLTTMPSPATALLYILVFGLGSTAGMLLLSGLIGLPFALLRPRSLRVATALQIVVGLVSVVIGVGMLVSRA
jgi:high-affinity nickel permease